MITKAFVEEVIKSNEVKLRIPVLDNINKSSIKTKNDSLPAATTCTLPNFSYNFRQGDIVYAEFEDNDKDKPVILGIQKNSPTKISGYALSINVNNFLKASKILSIGNVSDIEFSFLENLDINVQDSLNKYKENLEENKKLIENNNNILKENSTKLYNDFISIDNVNKSINTLKDKNKQVLEAESKTLSNFIILKNKIGDIDSNLSISEIINDLKDKVSNLEDSYKNGYTTTPDTDYNTIEYVSNYPDKKYNSLYECIMYDSTCYKGTSKMNIVGVLWHDTGANNKTIKRYVQPSKKDKNYNYLLNLIGKNNNGNDFNNSYKEAGVNAFIGTLNDGSIATVQTLPWDFRPWGCGSGSNGSCNSGWIQFEICEDSKNDSVYFKKIYDEAIKLTAYLCNKFKINPNGKIKRGNKEIPTILCHWDSHLLGMGSGHYDIYDWFPKFGKCKNLTMDDVRKDIINLMSQMGNN